MPISEKALKELLTKNYSLSKTRIIKLVKNSFKQK